MNREDFFQQAMLKMAEVILLRTDKEPTPEQLADKAKKYAVALHNGMLAGAVECDLHNVGAGEAPPEDAYVNDPPPADGIPTLGRGMTPPAREAPPACPDCSRLMKKRNGRYGEFWGCSGYPECRGIVKINGGW